jgi:hypothetical protein
MSSIDWVAFVLVIIGGINWGLIGFFGFDLVAAIFGGTSILTRIIYILVGLAAVWLIAVPVRSGRQLARAGT